MLQRAAQSLFHGVTLQDPATVLALIVLAAVGLAACYLPARRASRTDPLHALRSE